MAERTVQQIQEEAQRDFDEALGKLAGMLGRQPGDKPGDRESRIEGVKKAVDVVKEGQEEAKQKP